MLNQSKILPTSELIFIEKKENIFSYSLEDGNFKTLYYIDINDENTDFEINIHVKDNCQLNVSICCLNEKEFNKNYKVKIWHDGNNSQSTCEFYGLNKNFSKTHVDFKIFVKEMSKDNRCVQSIKGILLSDKTEFSGKPDLIINSNNIKAKHSLAIGVLNPKHINYLLSKGINTTVAKKLIIMGYFNVVLNSIKNDDIDLYNSLYNKIFKKIGKV